MNLEILTASKLIESIGWALVHSVWQIALIAAALFLIFRFFETLSASARYLFSVLALALVFFLPLATFIFFNNHSAGYLPAEIVASKNTNQLKTDLQQPESFPLAGNGNPSPINPATKSNYFFFEDLQDSFRRNLASVLPMLVWLWISGIVFCALRLGGGLWQLHKYKTLGISEPEPEWQKRFCDLCEKFKITQNVRLLESNLIETPIVAGFLKPLILVPASAFLQISPRQLETILAHELMHIRRYDNFVNFLQSFIEILFFYHPCAWWISAAIRREREYACDDRVVETLESPRFVYADALANLEEIRQQANKKTPPLAVAATGGKLMKRIERIIEKNTEKKQLSPKQSFWSASLALLLISVVVISVLSAQTGLSVNTKNEIKDKKIAIGFVSLPPVDRISPPQDADSTARLLIEKLKGRRIPAVGFVLGASISDGEKMYPVRANIVRLWRDAGFEIGIGGFRHIWFYNTPYEDYVANTEKNERLVKSILAEKNLPLRYFSYPFLNTGKTAADHERFETWLKERGLRSVKYTYDNQEWMYSFAYDMARKDNDLNTMKEIRAEFLDYMTKMLDHFEAYSKEMFGRDIPQTMVLTPSRLVADASDEFFSMLENRGYRFVSMDEAQQDETYKTKAAHVDSQSGISWFERWQMAQGKKLRDEPRINKLVWDIWNEKKNTK